MTKDGAKQQKRLYNSADYLQRRLEAAVPTEHRDIVMNSLTKMAQRLDPDEIAGIIQGQANVVTKCEDTMTRHVSLFIGLLLAVGYFSSALTAAEIDTTVIESAEDVAQDQLVRRQGLGSRPGANFGRHNVTRRPATSCGAASL